MNQHANNSGCAHCGSSNSGSADGNNYDNSYEPRAFEEADIDYIRGSAAEKRSTSKPSILTEMIRN
jgi:hypothetical protein